MTKSKTQVTINKKEIEKLNMVLSTEKPFGSPMTRGAFITIALNHLYDSIEKGETTYEDLLVQYKNILGGE